jgi:prefoldin subunit 5
MLEKFKLPLYIVGAVLLLVVIGWVSNSFPRQSVLDEYLSKRTVEITQKYEADMKAKDEKIKFLDERIKASEKVLSDIYVTVKKLEKKKDDVQKPNTRQETVDRSNKLGYPTK